MQPHQERVVTEKKELDEKVSKLKDFSESSPIFLNFHVVEPHADDAFLSLHQHMVNWRKAGHTVTIHTLIPVHRDSLDDARRYAKAIGAQWYGYGSPRERTADWKAIEPLKLDNMDVLLLPLAIRHPDHEAVRSILARPKACYYLDQPYAITQKLSGRVTELLAGMEVASYLKPHSAKYRHCTAFGSQSKFFHFNPPEKLRETFEMVVRKVGGR